MVKYFITILALTFAIYYDKSVSLINWLENCQFENYLKWNVGIKKKKCKK